jgi:hypothetical protein
LISVCARTKILFVRTCSGIPIVNLLTHSLLSIAQQRIYKNDLYNILRTSCELIKNLFGRSTLLFCCYDYWDGLFVWCMSTYT